MDTKKMIESLLKTHEDIEAIVTNLECIKGKQHAKMVHVCATLLLLGQNKLVSNPIMEDVIIHSIARIVQILYPDDKQKGTELVKDIRMIVDTIVKNDPNSNTLMK